MAWLAVLPYDLPMYAIDRCCISSACIMQRPLWRHYYQHTDGIIMVLDSNDRERLPYVSHELNLLLGEEELSGLPLLVLANKQDLPNAMTCNEIVDGLHLNSIRDRAWCECHALLCECATTTDVKRVTVVCMVNAVLVIS